VAQHLILRDTTPLLLVHSITTKNIAMQRAHAVFQALQGSGWLAPGLAACSRCASSSGSISCISTSAPCRQGSSEPSSKAEPLPLHLRDQILLKGMLFHGFHGACPEVCATTQGAVCEGLRPDNVISDASHLSHHIIDTYLESCRRMCSARSFWLMQPCGLI